MYLHTVYTFLLPYLKWNAMAAPRYMYVWVVYRGMCVRERESTAVVLAVRMPLEVCPGTRKTEHGRRTRMPKHIETTMQNTRQTRLFWPPHTHTYFYTLTHTLLRENTGPSTLWRRMPRHLRLTLHTTTTRDITFQCLLRGTYYNSVPFC